MLLLLDLLGFSDYPSSSPSSWRSISDDEIAYGTPWWWIYAGISAALVLFAGIMSGLTLGLMSLGLMDLEVLQQSGTEEEKKQAGKPFFPFFRLSFSLFQKIQLSRNSIPRSVMKPFTRFHWNRSLDVSSSCEFFWKLHAMRSFLLNLELLHMQPVFLRWTNRCGEFADRDGSHAQRSLTPAFFLSFLKVLDVYRRSQLIVLFCGQLPFCLW
jgi:hypothetical protein